VLNPVLRFRLYRRIHAGLCKTVVGMHNKSLLLTTRCCLFEGAISTARASPFRARCSRATTL
jgi:hypothetical protein